jgi:hypothetical protein
MTNAPALPPAQLNALYAQLTKEEHETVLEKMVKMVGEPAGHLPRQEELYLEQQLTDFFGFEITAELESVRLPHSIGIMQAQPHLRRHPTDVLNGHTRCRAAGIRQIRSALGWFTELGQLTDLGVQQEVYYFAVQATFLPAWQSSPALIKNWLRFRKMVMINPMEQRAVVGCIGDFGPAEHLQYQFGGSPEVIQDGKVWSPKTRGHVLLYFVNDPLNQVQLGPLDLRYDPD